MEQRADPDRATGPILIVDDDLTTRQFIELVLLKEGFEVDTAADGEEAIRRARVRPPSLVLLDWVMPGPHPKVTAAVLRAALGTDVRVVLISAVPGARDLARDLGAIACLEKPFEVDGLVATVRSVLRPIPPSSSTASPAES